MGTKLFSLLSIVVFAFFSSCYQCPDFEYFVETTWTIENAPKNDTLTVGDTLWVSSEFKDELADTNTKETIRLNNTLPIKFPIGPIEFYKNDSQAGSKYDSKVANESFSLVYNNLFHNNDMIYEYIDNQNSFKFRLGYIAKKKGIYYIKKNPHTSGSYQGSRRCRYTVDIYSELVPKNLQNSKYFFPLIGWVDDSSYPFQYETDANAYFFVVK